MAKCKTTKCDDAVKVNADAEEAKNAAEEQNNEAAEEKHEPTELELATAEIEKLKKELLEVNDSKLRLQADFENHRKRNNQLRLDSLNDGKCMVVLEMLKSLDNFERALKTECQDAGYASGMQMIYKMLCDSLASLGLEEITDVTVFDPNIHEAVISEEVENEESGKIIAVLQKGYKFNGKVIRPTMVKVTK